MTRATGRPTLADVAERSGLSKTAVSLILNDKPNSRLSADAAARVRRAAAELGYRPNPAARSLRIGKTRTIGFVSDEVTVTRFASDMIRGVLGAAQSLEHSVLIAETSAVPDGLRSAVDSMIDRRTDGLLFGLMAARSIVVPDLPAGVPVVIVNGTTQRGDTSVLPDERTAGRDVTRVLLEAGHRRIAIIGDASERHDDPAETVTIPLRFRAVHDALTEAGIRPVAAVPVADWQPEQGFRTVREVLVATPGITALVCANDRVAFGAYQAIADLGLRVPDDVSVVSFDDEELAAFQRPGLTTARLPYREMARIGVEMLLGSRERRDELVPMPVVERSSVRRLA